jgi:electron transfer flavoprotein alpha subunit
MSAVLVVAEHSRGVLRPMSLEALAAGRQLALGLGAPLHAAVCGASVGDLAGALARYAAAAVHAVEHPLLAAYTADATTAALHQLIARAAPAAVVFPHTYQARDFAPLLATRLGRPLITDVTGIRFEDGAPVFERQLFQGRLHADYAIASSGPVLVSVQAGAFRADALEAGTAPVEAFVPELEAAAIRQQPEEPFRESARAVDLASAGVIVAVGRGIREEGNIELARRLAEALGAELAASRPICDHGWLPMERQVGSSGQTVAPKLYIALGISGAIQHLVGMRGSKCIVAVNKDMHAPIFEAADYGVAGDLLEVVPALTEEVLKARS